MIIVRVVQGIADHFPARASEWALSGILFSFGSKLLSEEPMFTGPIWSGLARVANEAAWGWACVFVGGLRLAALVINGTFAGFRRSPHLRAAMALFSCFFWLQISIGFWNAGAPTTGLAVYPFLLLLDMSNVFRAMGDAADVDLLIRREKQEDGRERMV